MHGSATTRTTCDKQASAKPIVIDCSVPPSLNRLWRVGRGRRVYKDPKAKRWQWEFFAAIARKYSNVYIDMPFNAEILICPKRKRDADNNSKLLLDTCQALGIIKNDSLARKVTQELVGRDRAPLGCRLIITPLKS